MLLMVSAIIGIGYRLPQTNKINASTVFLFLLHKRIILYGLNSLFMVFTPIVIHRTKSFTNIIVSDMEREE